MDDLIYRVAMNVVIGASFGRSVVVSALAARTFAKRRDFLTLKMGAVERFITPEPIVLGLATAWVLFRETHWEEPSRAQAAAAAAGAALAIAGLDLIAWSWRSWRGIFFGHGLVTDQKLITSGAYGFVRHPVYAGALLIWLGLAVGGRSIPVAAITFAYVIPGYLLYLRSEEQMMAEAFGDGYARYRAAVPMLIPRLRRGSRGPHPAGS